VSATDLRSLHKALAELRLTGAPEPAAVSAAEEALAQAAALAWSDYHAKHSVVEAARQAEIQARVLDRPMADAIDRAVRLLLDQGPMSAVDIEARRLPGLSHNAVRPVLREATARGLVEKIQLGKRVVWSAVG